MIRTWYWSAVSLNDLKTNRYPAWLTFHSNTNYRYCVRTHTNIPCTEKQPNEPPVCRSKVSNFLVMVDRAKQNKNGNNIHKNLQWNAILCVFTWLKIQKAYTFRSFQVKWSICMWLFVVGRESRVERIWGNTQISRGIFHSIS